MIHQLFISLCWFSWGGFSINLCFFHSSSCLFSLLSCTFLILWENISFSTNCIRCGLVSIFKSIILCFFIMLSQYLFVLLDSYFFSFLSCQSLWFRCQKCSIFGFICRNCFLEFLSLNSCLLFGFLFFNSFLCCNILFVLLCCEITSILSGANTILWSEWFWDSITSDLSIHTWIGISTFHRWKMNWSSNLISNIWASNWLNLISSVSM